MIPRRLLHLKRPEIELKSGAEAASLYLGLARYVALDTVPALALV